MVANSQIKLNTRIELNKEKIGALALVCLLYYPLLNAGIYALLNQISPSLLGVLSVMLVGFEGALIYGAVLAYARNKKNVVFSVTICIIIALLYMATFLFFPENTLVLLGTIRRVLLFCIPSLLLAYFIDGFDSVWYYLHRFSYVLIICGILHVISGRIQANKLNSDYSMWLGYQLIIPVMVLIWNTALQTRRSGLRIFGLLFFVIGLAIIMFYGSRGSLLVIALYSIYCIYIYHRRKIVGSRHKLLMKLIIIFSFSIFLMMFALAVSNVELLSSYLYSIAQDHGIQSRNLMVLSMDNALSYVSGRDVIYAVAIELIKESPLTGYGLAGDCVQIGRALGKSPDSSAGSYAHNFYLALMLNFGVLVGTALFCGVVYLFYKKLKVLGECAEKSLLVVLGFCCISLMFSGNYLTYYPLWLLIGITLKRQVKLRGKENVNR